MTLRIFRFSCLCVCVKAFVHCFFCSLSCSACDDNLISARSLLLFANLLISAVALALLSNFVHRSFSIPHALLLLARCRCRW